MSDLTPERLAELRTLAAAATPGPWTVESYWDRLDGPADTNTSWHIPGLERWHGSLAFTNNVGFGDDEATARYVAAISPDVVVGLLDEIERLRAGLDELANADHEDDLIGAVSAAAERQGAPAPDRVVDLMAALERSVAAAKEARTRHPKPGGTRLDDILSEDEIAELAREFDR